MRRSDREITDLSEILSIINDCKVIRLATLDEEGLPYLIPLNFGYQCESGRLTLYCHSAREGRKLDLLRRDPRVTFEMDCRGALEEAERACNYSYFSASVIGRATAELLEGEEKLLGLTALMRHMAGREDRFTLEQARGVEVIALRVQSLTAKSKKLRT